MPPFDTSDTDREIEHLIDTIDDKVMRRILQIQEQRYLRGKIEEETRRKDWTWLMRVAVLFMPVLTGTAVVVIGKLLS